jgi:hypothetical protein
MLRRISWGAVLAGVAVALVSQLALNALGLSIGAATIEPATTAGPTAGEFTTAAIIWMAASALLSLFAGGYVAGRMAGTSSATEGIIHGLTVWAVAAILTALSLNVGVNTVLGGVTDVLSAGTNLVQNGVQAISPAVADATDQIDIQREAIGEEVRSLLISIDEDPQGAAGPGAEGDLEVDTTSATEQQINLTLDRLFRLGIDAADDADRRDAIQTLAANTELNEAEAREQINQWEDQYATAVTNLEQTIESTADDFANTVSTTAGIIFAIMVVSAAAAGGGGFVGTPMPHEIVDMQEDALEDAAEAA